MLASLKDGDYDQAFHILKTNRSPEAELCLGFLLKYVLYALRATELVGYDIHSADDVMATGFNWCPPLAMIEALGGLDEFRRLYMERIRQEDIDKIQLKQLLQRVEPSKYDFRKFIKAKR